MDCGKILSDLMYDCSKPPITGIEQRIVLINRADIDKTATTIDSDNTTGKHVITNLALNTGATGYLITGINSKQIFTSGWNINVAEDQPDDFTHMVTIRLFNCDEASASFVNNLASGADLVAVVLKKNGCIEVYGYNSGLKISEGTNNSNENKGTSVITLSSLGVDTEPKVPYLYLDTDEATSLDKFNAKFSA